MQPMLKTDDTKAPASLAELKKSEKEARRLLIMRAAQALFAENGFKGVTVRQIAKKAGVSIGTIYNYYAGLDDLFFDIFLEHTKEILEIMSGHAEKNELTPQTVGKLYITYLQRNMSFFQLMGHFMLGGVLSPESADKLNTVMRTLMTRLENVLKKAGICGDTRIRTHAFFAALNGIMISYARYPGRSEKEINAHIQRLTEEIASLFT
ncbi:MAG: hypothetical protein B5M56_05815 [Desulfococcus sp. 4484_241]|nr:MAG: hypothetical protein B5M56_05815 [Desulfococcus sp. 4484_241]